MTVKFGMKSKEDEVLIFKNIAIISIFLENTVNLRKINLKLLNSIMIHIKFCINLKLDMSLDSKNKK